MFPLPAELLLLGEAPSWQSTEFSERSYGPQHSTNDFLCFVTFPFAPALVYKTLFFYHSLNDIKTANKGTNYSRGTSISVIAFYHIESMRWESPWSPCPFFWQGLWDLGVEWHAQATWRVGSSVRTRAQGFPSCIQDLCHKATLGFHTTLLRPRAHRFWELTWEVRPSTQLSLSPEPVVSEPQIPKTTSIHSAQRWGKIRPSPQFGF